MVAGDRGNGELVFNGDRVSEREKVQEVGGSGCTTV